MNFAHLLRWAAAIRARPAAETLRFAGLVIGTTLPFLIFAQRAFCAAAMRDLPAAEILPLPEDTPPLDRERSDAIAALISLTRRSACFCSACKPDNTL